MKHLLPFCILWLSGITALAQTPAAMRLQPDPAQKTKLVEAACGQCRFAIGEKDCDLAVRIDGKAYFVDGTGIDDHGDAHASDGFCQTIRKAQVQGEMVGNRFKAMYFKLLPSAPETPKK